MTHEHYMVRERKAPQDGQKPVSFREGYSQCAIHLVFGGNVEQEAKCSRSLLLPSRMHLLKLHGRGMGDLHDEPGTVTGPPFWAA